MKNKQLTSKAKARTAADLDEMHDTGVELTAYLDMQRSSRPGRSVQRVNVDFPVDLLRQIDREARRLGVTRQAFIKIRVADSLVKKTS
jgi:hypothetical protein